MINIVEILMHKSKHLPIAVKWVLVRIEGKKNPQAFFSNNVQIDALDLLKQYMLRWNLEVTFEEARAHLGVETQRHCSDLAIARTTPVLFGLFSLITCAALQFYRNAELSPKSSAWYKKSEITFHEKCRPGSTPRPPSRKRPRTSHRSRSLGASR